jgi:hypothetical protein
MRLHSFARCAFSFLPILVGCSTPPEHDALPADRSADEAPALLDDDVAAAREELLAAATASACAASNTRCLASNLQRTPLRDDIVEYSLELKVGPGEFDRIGLHRVTRERAPWRPVASGTAVFLVHGDAWSFNPIFVGGAPKAPVAREEAAALYFVERGIDVWGIDRRWVQSPADTEDFSFMQSWTIGEQVNDIGVGLGVARALRTFTGSGAGRLHLLGFSRGAALSYAYANAETQVPPALRHVKGLVPVDYAYKYDPADPAGLAANACDTHEFFLGFFNDGFAGYSNSFFADLGALAESDPAGESPLEAGISNSDYTIRTFTAEAPSVGPGSFSPFFHVVGSTHEGTDYQLLHSDEDTFFDFLQGAVPVESFREEVESAAIACAAVDTPYDDHLGAINLPVFYVGAAGGFGDTGLYTLGLLGGGDKTSLMVRQRPAGEEIFDYGHQELFIGRDARELAWTPIADWLLSH